MVTTDHDTSQPAERKHGHYFKDISHLSRLDIYRVCDLFIKNDPSGALAHTVKKLLAAGGRGAGKDARKDIQEAIDTLQRKLEMLDEDGRMQPEFIRGFGIDHGSPDGDATVIATIMCDKISNGKITTARAPLHWVPPGDGWVEVPDDLMVMPSGLLHGDATYLLVKEERDRQRSTIFREQACNINWALHHEHPRRIVAYKTLEEKQG